MLYSEGELKPAPGTTWSEMLARLLAFFIFLTAAGLGLWHAGGWCLKQGDLLRTPSSKN